MEKPIKKTATAKAVKIAPKKTPVKKTGVTKVVKLTRTQKCIKIIQLIEIEGLSLNVACKSLPMARSDFHNEMNESPELLDKYARACENRAKIILNEVLEIADDESKDEKAFYGAVKVKRDALRIETRLKYLAMMYPKKYGSKVEISGDKENPLQVVHNIVALGSGVNPNESNEVKEIE
jgi:hypothetical protein